MKLQDLVETDGYFQDRESWAMAVIEAGATELLREVGDEPYPTDIHLYAVGGNRLYGTWNMKTQEGSLYSGRGMTFDKRNRRFEKVEFV